MNIDSKSRGTMQERNRSVRHDAASGLAVLIARHIDTNGFPPGKHLSAQELAETFKASRTPVSRALRLLLQQGRVTHSQNRGYFVANVPEAAPDGTPRIERDEITVAYDAVVKDRLAGALPTSVTETHLKTRYSLSKSQLNVLLSRIAGEGWIERRAGYGWLFTEILTTPEALAQTLRLRQAVEPASLLEPGYRLDRALAAQCRAAEIEMLRGGIESMSPEALFARGVRFHECLVGGSQNPFFLETIRRVNRIRRMLSHLAMRDRSRYRRPCEEHLVLLDLLEQERNEDACKALRTHLENVGRSYNEIRALLTA